MSGNEMGMEVLTKAIGLRAQRHQVLASNIANADTPNFKARDFDFRDAMQHALAGRPLAGGLDLARTSAGHLDGAAGSAAVHLQFRRDVQSAVDGNTVDMDVERGQIAENAMHYDILTRLITDRLQGMRAALTSNQG